MATKKKKKAPQERFEKAKKRLENAKKKNPDRKGTLSQMITAVVGKESAKKPLSTKKKTGPGEGQSTGEQIKRVRAATKVIRGGKVRKRAGTRKKKR